LICCIKIGIARKSDWKIKIEKLMVIKDIRRKITDMKLIIEMNT
jgi:hypothetical protein